MGVAMAATEVIMERERLDMVVMVVAMVEVMEEAMVEDMEEAIEEDMVEDTGDDLSYNLNSLTAFDFCYSCILSSPGFGCSLTLE